MGSSVSAPLAVTVVSAKLVPDIGSGLTLLSNLPTCLPCQSAMQSSWWCHHINQPCPYHRFVEQAGQKLSMVERPHCHASNSGTHSKEWASLPVQAKKNACGWEEPALIRPLQKGEEIRRTTLFPQKIHRYCRAILVVS